MSDYTIDVFNFALTVQGWQWRLPIIAVCAVVVWWFTVGFNDWMDR